MGNDDNIELLNRVLVFSLTFFNKSKIWASHDHSFALHLLILWCLFVYCAQSQYYTLFVVVVKLEIQVNVLTFAHSTDFSKCLLNYSQHKVFIAHVMHRLEIHLKLFEENVHMTQIEVFKHWPTSLRKNFRHLSDRKVENLSITNLTIVFFEGSEFLIWV